MEQAVDAADVDERAEVGDILDHSGEFLAYLEAGQQFGLFLASGLLEHLLSRKHDVPAPFRQLDDAKRVGLTKVLIEVADGPAGNLRCRKESVESYVDLEPAFYFPDDFPLDEFIVFEVRLYFGPVLDLIGFCLGKDYHAVLVLDHFDKHVELVAHFHLVGLGEFAERNCPFRFEAYINEDRVAPEGNNRSLDYFALFEVLDRHLIDF